MAQKRQPRAVSEPCGWSAGLCRSFQTRHSSFCIPSGMLGMLGKVKGIISVSKISVRFVIVMSHY